MPTPYMLVYLIVQKTTCVSTSIILVHICILVSFIPLFPSQSSLCTCQARTIIQRKRTASTIDHAKLAFQQAQMLLCVSHANVSIDTPVKGAPLTWLLQFELTFPEPNNCMALSISTVSHNTNKMKAPSNMPPGIKSLRPASMSIMMRKMMVKDAVTIANGKSLCECQC
jgi:hypothetical protein